MDPCLMGAGYIRGLMRVGLCRLAVLFIRLAVVLALPLAAREDPPQVKEIKGRFELQEYLLYELPNLKPKDHLSVYPRGTSDTLDPFTSSSPSTSPSPACCFVWAT